MADNTARIAEIRALLESGVTSATVKGETVTYNLASLRAELRRLESTDDDLATAGYRKRPRMSAFRLG